MFNFKCLSKITITISAATMALLLSGCNGFTHSAVTAPVAVVIPGPLLQGGVHGGQQPIAGAAIYLYAASVAGYAASNSNILTAPVTSDASGRFSVTSKYTCTAGQQMYIVAVGGNTGSGINNNAATMAALGECSNLKPSTFISMNEVTTVGSVFALAPFMSSYTAIGTSPTNTAGLVRAFASVNKLINTANGSAPGPALPAGAAAPAAEVFTLANVLAACVNSTGGVAGDGTACGTLFSLATPPGGAAPVDTIGAALSIARHPALNVSDLFFLTSPFSPFMPQLTRAPKDWTMGITYTNAAFSAPKSTTVDTHGNIWIANSGNDTLTVLSQAGTPSQISGNGLDAPSAVAIDANGNAWVANKGASTVSTFTSAGGTFSGSPFTGAGLNKPSAIAIDAPGNIWVTNSGSNSVSELAPTGAPIQQLTSGVASPSAVAINPK